MKTRFGPGGYQSPSRFSFLVSYALPGVERRELSLTLSYPLSPASPSAGKHAVLLRRRDLRVADNHEELYAYYKYQVRQPVRQHERQ